MSDRGELNRDGPQHGAVVTALLAGSARLVEATTEIAVTEAVLDAAMAAVGAAIGVVRRLDQPRRKLVVVSTRNVAVEVFDAELSLDEPSLACRAAQEQRVLAVENLEEVRILPIGAVPEGTVAFVNVPMVLSGRTVGTVGLGFHEAHAFDQATRDSLLTFAHQGALALERARLMASQRQALVAAAESAARTAALHRVTQAFSRSLTIEDVLDAALDAVVDVLRPDAVIAVLRAGERVLRQVGARGELADAADGPQFIDLDAARPVCAVARDGRPRWYDARSELDAEFGPGHSTPAVGQSAGVVPLSMDGAPIGAIAVLFDRPHRLNQPDRDLLLSLSALCSEALRRARLYEDDHRSATRRLAIQRATVSFSKAQSVEQLQAAAVLAIHEGLSSDGECSAGYLDEDGRLHVVYTEGPPGASVGRSEIIDTTTARRPLAAVARDGRARRYDNRAAVVAEFGPVNDSPERHGAGAVVPMLAEGGAVLGVLAASSPQPNRWDPADYELLETIAALGAEAARRLELSEIERRADARTVALHRVTEAFSRSVTVDDVLVAAITALADALQPVTAGATMIDRDGHPQYWYLEPGRSAAGVIRPVAGPGRDIDRIIGPVLADGRARLIENLAQAEAEFGPAEHFPFPLVGGGFMPLVIDDRVVGVLGISFAQPHRWRAGDRELVESLASLCAEAIRRARLYEDERRAAGRAVALHRVTAAFARASDLNGIVAPVFDCLLEVLRPNAVAAGLIEHDEVRLVSFRTEEPNDYAGGLVFPLDAKRPFCATARDGRARWIERRSDIVAEFGPDTEASAEFDAGVVLPLVAGGIPLGSLAVIFDAPHHFDPLDRELLETLAQLCSEAIRRTQLHDDELRAASRRVALMEATEAFSRAATVAEVLDTAVAAVDKLLASATTVTAHLEEDGVLRLRARRGDGGRTSEAAAVPPDDQARAVLAAYADGQARWYIVHGDAPAARARRAKPVRAGAALPLVAQGMVFGVIGIRCDVPRRIVQADRFALEALVTLCSEALRRARLYEAEHRAAERSMALHRLTEAFSRVTTSDEVLEVAVSELHRVLGATTTGAAVLRDGCLHLVTSRGPHDPSVRTERAATICAGRPLNAAVADGRPRWFDSTDPAGADAELAAFFEHDEHDEHDEHEGPGRPFGAGALLPLIIDDRPLGILAVGFLEARRIRSADRELIETVAALCSEALRRARHFDETQAAAVRYQSLFDNYEQLFRSNPMAMVVYADGDHRILASNEAMRLACGYDADELTAMTVIDLMHDSERERFRARVARRRQENSPYEHLGLVLLQRKDGSTYFVEASGHDAEDFAGRPARLGLLVDQTARVAAEHANRELQARVVAVAEEERRRIAEDLHDGPVQQLSIAAMRLSALRRQSDPVDDALLARIRQVERDVQFTVEELRTMMQKLYPPSLDEMTLGEAISDAMPELPWARQLEVRLEDHLQRPLPAGLKAALYRVAMEALANVHKHADANAVSIELRDDETTVELRVVDDGIGIDETARQRAGHLGLASMQDRISLLGGECRIDRLSDAGGTVVQARVPRPAATS